MNTIKRPKLKKKNIEELYISPTVPPASSYRILSIDELMDVPQRPRGYCETPCPALTDNSKLLLAI